MDWLLGFLGLTGLPPCSVSGSLSARPSVLVVVVYSGKCQWHCSSTCARRRKCIEMWHVVTQSLADQIIFISLFSRTCQVRSRPLEQQSAPVKSWAFGVKLCKCWRRPKKLKPWIWWCEMLRSVHVERAVSGRGHWAYWWRKQMSLDTTQTLSSKPPFQVWSLKAHFFSLESLQNNNPIPQQWPRFLSVSVLRSLRLGSFHGSGGWWSIFCCRCAWIDWSPMPLASALASAPAT